MSAEFSFSFEDEDIESGSDAEQRSPHHLLETGNAYVGIEPQVHFLQELV